MESIFKKEITDNFIDRINKLTPSTQPKWGKMSVDQMLAHVNVSYEMLYTDVHPKPKGLKKILVKALIKNVVVSEKPYKHNMRTHPLFLIENEREFQKEKKRIIEYLEKTQQLGEAEFEGKESHSFGNLTSNEWNNLFSKHLEHHLGQFGV